MTSASCVCSRPVDDTAMVAQLESDLYLPLATSFQHMRASYAPSLQIAFSRWAPWQASAEEGFRESRECCLFVLRKAEKRPLDVRSRFGRVPMLNEGGRMLEEGGKKI